MVQGNVLVFVNWYIANKEGNGSNYLGKSFKNSKQLFLEKIFEYANEFKINFGFNPFEINYNKINDEFINEVEVKLKEKNIRFIEYNVKNGNGIPNAIFGKSNYLRFLNEIRFLQLHETELKRTVKLPFRKEFLNFLIEEQGYTVGSAGSYATYVVSANSTVFSKFFKSDFLLKLSDLIDKKQNKDINKHLELGLTQIIKCEDLILKSKYKNGFIEYQNFINTELVCDVSETDDDTIIEDERYIANSPEKDFVRVETTHEEYYEFKLETKNSRELSPVVILDQESILKNFYFRLTTQDRLYGEIFYPISLIKKIFYLDKENRKYFDELINNQINKIKIISNGHIFYLKAISNLLIIPGSSVNIVGDDSSQYNVFTEDGYDGSFKLMKVDLFKEIAIDHVTPMKELLIKHSNKLPKLKSITELLKEQGISGTGKELLKSVRQAGNCLIETGVLGIKDIEELKSELEFLNSFSQFQLMDWKENLKKNKKK